MSDSNVQWTQVIEVLRQANDRLTGIEEAAEASEHFQSDVLRQENLADGNQPGAFGNPRVFRNVRDFAAKSATRTQKSLAALEQQPGDPAAIRAVIATLNERLELMERAANANVDFQRDLLKVRRLERRDG